MNIYANESGIVHLRNPVGVTGWIAAMCGRWYAMNRDSGEPMPVNKEAMFHWQRTDAPPTCLRCVATSSLR